MWYELQLQQNLKAELKSELKAETDFSVLSLL
jgi:hypothetical protein